MKLWNQIRFLFSRRRREAELEEELAFHLDEEAEECKTNGIPPEQARYSARAQLGNMARVREETRATWGFTFIETTIQDLRVAFRYLKKNPGFTIIAVSVLGLGMGASTAIFSVVDAVVLKSLAYKDPDRIVALRSLWVKTGVHGQVSFPDYEDWRAQSASFESMALYSNSESAVELDSGAEFANIATVSQEFFRVFGVVPQAGHFFEGDEIKPGSAAGAAIVSNSFWRTRLGGSSSALGKSIRVGGRSIQIVGITPPGFDFPEKTEIWMAGDTLFPILSPNRGGHNFLVVAKLKSNVALGHAQSDMAVIGARLAEQYKTSNENKSVSVAPLNDELVRDVRTMLYVLLGSVFLVLLIACGNVANLLLAKAATRTRELGVRVALGAAHGRIIRQLATESLVLGLMSGLVGLALARFGTRVLISLAPGNVPRLEEAGLDTAVLVFSAGLTVLACLLFGMAPALRVTRINVNEAVKSSGGRNPKGVSAAARQALVVAEMGLSVVLLTGAALLMRSFFELSNSALGFETHQVLVAETSMPARTREAATRVVAAYQTVIEQIAAIPGITAVAADRVPPGAVGSTGAYEVDQAARAGALSVNSPMAVYSIVSPGVFSVLGIPLKAGRDFSTADSPDAPLTAIINETLANRAFPGRDPIGHVILNGMDILKPLTIVGVVGDIRQGGPGAEKFAEIFMPFQQHPLPSTSMRILARVSGNPENYASAIRDRFRRLAPEMSVRFTTMDTQIEKNVAGPKFRTLMLTIFAAIAVVLAMAGVYGVVSFLVNQRTQEIGVRMALGASAPVVARMVLSQGVRMAILGLILGVAGAGALAQTLRSLLFQVQPLDPRTYAIVAGMIALATLGASFLPAWRASKIDPMLALREE
jgi:predicted permease